VIGLKALASMKKAIEAKSKIFFIDIELCGTQIEKCAIVVVCGW
jgi:hypothetical protein